MGKEALVIKRETLFKEKFFQGFLPLDAYDYFLIIKTNFFYHERGDALENDFSLQQVIPYVWIFNPEKKEVFLYKRTLNGKKQSDEYKEIRYLNKFSGGVGGHIDRDTEENVENPIRAAMLRELKEEVLMTDYPIPEIIGYINDDSDSIGKVHFGIVAVAKTLESVVSNDAEGLSSGRFYTLEEIEQLFADPENEIENWTRISWPFVKDYLLTQKS